MDDFSEHSLATLIREARVASLATIRDGEPFLSLLGFAAAPDFSVFYVHVNRLAQHAVDMQKNRRVGLLIHENHDGQLDPEALLQVAIRGSADVLPKGEPGYLPARELYLTRFPYAKNQFDSEDFMFWAIKPKGGRFVNGIAGAHNLNAEALVKASARD